MTDVAPNITSPSGNLTETLNSTDAYIRSIECEATGSPAPDVYWTQDFVMRFGNSTTLQIQITDLTQDGEKVFYCIAENRVGRDVVSVRYNLVIMAEEAQNKIDDIVAMLNESETISDETSAETAAFTKVIIDAVNNNDDISNENKIELLETAVSTINLIVEKTNETFSDETTSKITELLSSIVSVDASVEQDPEVPTENVSN